MLRCEDSSDRGTALDPPGCTYTRMDGTAAEARVTVGTWGTLDALISSGKFPPETQNVLKPTRNVKRESV